MKNWLRFLFLLFCLFGCQTQCPPVLEDNFEGDGFLVSNEPSKFPTIFFPACDINKNSFLSSLHNKNLGDGLLIETTFAHRVMIRQDSNRFALLNHAGALGTYLDGVYILPIHMRYTGKKPITSCKDCSVDFELKDSEIKKTYSFAAIKIDTMIVLSCKP